jgi:hypothetical protein
VVFDDRDLFDRFGGVLGEGREGEAQKEGKEWGEKERVDFHDRLCV